MVRNVYLTALKLLARRSYSRERLREKLLAKKLDLAAIETVLNQLASEKYLREEEYRQQQIAKLLNKKWSSGLVREKLQQESLEVTAEEIAAVQRDLQITSEEAIRSLIRRKLPRQMPTDRIKFLQLQAKIGRFLQSKGYRYEEFRLILATEIKQLLGIEE